MTAAGDEAALGVSDVEQFGGIVAFVERTTAMIWDDKNPGLVARWYTPTTVVHTSDGDVYGRDAVIASAIRKMAAFPDIRDHVEDTIAVPLPGGGWRTSMRWTWTARNTGWGTYGPPTGRAVATRGIAHCIVRDGRYVEEWVAYDELTTLRQLGLDVAEQLRAEAPVAPAPHAGEVDRLAGQDFPGPLGAAELVDAPPVEALVRRGLHEIWNRRMLGAVADLYAPTAAVHGPDGRELQGPGDVRQEVLALLAMLPDARHTVDEIYHVEVGEADHKVAVRWTVQGTHAGPSRYGPPTGRRVRILGLSQMRVTGGVVVEEWTVWSEYHLMKQLHVERPSGGPS
jgi:predicted ester cyclase